MAAIFCVSLSDISVRAGSSDSLISVIIPAYNAGSYICQCLASVVGQTYRDIEIIVVDDGSTDDTAQRVRGAASGDSRILLFQTDRRGVSHARNLAIAKARGDLIAPIDADDLWAIDKLERQFNLLSTSSSKTGVVYCGAAGIDDRNRIILPVWNDRYASGNVLYPLIESGILSCGSTPLIIKRYAERVGGYDETLALAEDWKFYTALAAEYDFAVIPECLTGYRIRDDSSSVQVEPMEAALEKCTQWIRQTWPDAPESVLRERAFTIETYLAFMSIRARRYGAVPRYLLRATRTKPSALLSMSIWELALLSIAHAAGLRRYEWAFWRQPKLFDGKS